MAILGNFLPIEKRWDCVLQSVQLMTHDTCRPLLKDAEAIRRVKRQICDQEVAGSIPGRATLCNDCGQVDFFGDDVVFYRITLISCLYTGMIFNSNVKRGQTFKAEAEAECSRPRPNR